mmetsp:Transcript_24856/g.58352  ORF Transcript_24856/g.58352 Transcript_24856/m.58352 type:complete len:519 (-) Transcript_24856:106-1662(-)
MSDRYGPPSSRPNGGGRGYDLPPPQRNRNSNRGGSRKEDYYCKQEQQDFSTTSRGEEQSRDDRGLETDNRWNYHQSTNRRGDDQYETRQSQDWKCLECGIWNYPDEERCHRCGAFAEEMHAPDTRHRHGEDFGRHHNSYDDRSGDRSREDDPTEKSEQEDEVDEFGRKKPPAKLMKKEKSEWPPCFDKEGGAFVFDSRSGMFYEQLSDFFYNPQNKMYYGNKQKAYYRYNGEKKPPFEEVTKVEGDQGKDGSDSKGSELEPILGFSGTTTTKKPGSMGISIKLKTKKLPQKTGQPKKGTVDTPMENSTNPLKRQHHADMGKWSERQEELKEGSKEVRKQESEEPARKKRREISRTPKGEPICALCQRKFPNMDKLLYHERVSKLHAENIKKKQNQAQKSQAMTKHTSTEEAEKQYVDRAKQRRDLYGSDGSSRAVAVMTSDTNAETIVRPEVVATEVVRPEDTLGDQNVGNKMLQKLGWKSGQSLGRQKPAGGEGEGSTADNLKKDWKRIEAMAGAQR